MRGGGEVKGPEVKGGRASEGGSVESESKREQTCSGVRSWRTES